MAETTSSGELRRLLKEKPEIFSEFPMDEDDIRVRFRNLGDDERRVQQETGGLVSGMWAKDIWRQIIDNIALPAAEKQSLLEPQLFVVGVPELWIHTRTTSTSDGVIFVLCSYGMLAFLYGFVRAIAPMFVLPGDETAAPPSQGATARRLAIKLDWATSLAHRPGRVSIPATDKQHLAAAELTFAAEWFVLCHELGHVTAGHKEALNPSWEEEFQADALAMERFIEVMVGRRLNDRQGAVGYAGIELFFHAVHLMESFGELRESKSHPPAALRLARLRELPGVRSLPEPIRQLSGQLDRILADLTPLVLEFSPKHPCDGGTRRDVERKRLLQLLDTARNPEDFSREAYEQVEESPSAVLEALRDALRAAQEVLRTSKETSSPEWLRAYRHWSSIATLASNYESDVRHALRLRGLDEIVPPEVRKFLERQDSLDQLLHAAGWHRPAAGERPLPAADAQVEVEPDQAIGDL
jgi:hypothetical protein